MKCIKVNPAKAVIFFLNFSSLTVCPMETRESEVLNSLSVKLDQSVPFLASEQKQILLRDIIKSQFGESSVKNISDEQNFCGPISEDFLEKVLGNEDDAQSSLLRKWLIFKWDAHLSKPVFVEKVGLVEMGQELADIASGKFIYTKNVEGFAGMNAIVAGVSEQGLVNDVDLKMSFLESESAALFSKIKLLRQIDSSSKIEEKEGLALKEALGGYNGRNFLFGGTACFHWDLEKKKPVFVSKLSWPDYGKDFDENSFLNISISIEGKVVNGIVIGTKSKELCTKKALCLSLASAITNDYTAKWFLLFKNNFQREQLEKESFRKMERLALIKNLLEQARQENQALLELKANGQKSRRERVKKAVDQKRNLQADVNRPALGELKAIAEMINMDLEEERRQKHSVEIKMEDEVKLQKLELLEQKQLETRRRLNELGAIDQDEFELMIALEKDIAKIRGSVEELRRAKRAEEERRIRIALANLEGKQIAID